MARKIPYAVANYEEIVDDGYHFVDKTRFIREIERYKIPIFLRPRRFGKSLWCSILECYYDVNRRARFEALFGHTDIGREPTPLRNSHLILRFDFSKVEVLSDYGRLRHKFNSECRNAFSRFLGSYGRLAKWAVEELPEDAAEALARLLALAQAAGLPPLHIIVDEYDNFTNQLLTARLDRLYDQVVTGDSFLRSFYKVIKAGVGEGSVARVFVTGVLPITIDDLTSGFNIGQIITLKEHTLEMMGFTQTEVDAYLEAIFAEHPAWPAGLRRQVGDDLRTHYNGYRFLADHDWAALFAGYWTQYVGQVPAQAFDQANENFFRTTFYELCTRYLSPDFAFAIEVNHPSDRSDWEAVGRAGTPFENQAAIIEFKHFSVADSKRLGLEAWTEPRPQDVAQVDRYADALRRRHPKLAVRRHLVYTTAGRAFRLFTLD